jgi:transposase InsO family protein
MGLEAIYPQPRSGTEAAQHKVYPYLLREVEIRRPYQVWSTDITYIPMAQGFIVSGSDLGLVQPLCTGVAALEYPRRCLLS